MARSFYSRDQLLRMLHLKPALLARWQRQGLFPSQNRYEWKDLRRAQALAQYDAAASRTLRRSLEAVRRRFPTLQDPLLEAGLGVFAGRVELHYGGVYMDALSGQLRMPFESADGGQRRELRPLQTPALQRHQEAEQWFTFGLSLEGEPELRDQAAAAYEHCLELDPGFTSAFINLGTLRYQEKNFAAAERCYRGALQLDPNYALAYFNLGNVLDETGRLEEAVAAYTAAVRIVPDYADAHYNLALAFQRQGQHRRAVPHWRLYLGLDRQSPWANHARTQLRQTMEKEKLKVVRSGAQ